MSERSVSIDTEAIARRLIEANMYMTIATSDGDGRPWVSPVWFAPASDTELFWVSAPDARHSRNLAVRPEIAIVIFDSTVPVGSAEALYLEAVAEQVADHGVGEAIHVYSRRSQACGARPWTTSDVLAPARFRVYRATANARWVLQADDRRLPVRAGS
jgi:nitroimidazol reductase NimA-like FMN-containing flavoprotein (pyridoxamine 5'-phosphate oxidase superfamily)